MRLGRAELSPVLRTIVLRSAPNAPTKNKEPREGSPATRVIRGAGSMPHSTAQACVSLTQDIFQYRPRNVQGGKHQEVLIRQASRTLAAE